MPIAPLEFSAIKEKQPITLIVKITSACNFACRYCDADIYSNKIMSLAVLEAMIKDTVSTGRNVQFTWHGGEPLIAGLPFFKEAMRLQKKYHNGNQIITNSIQTNASLLTESWVEFFKHNKFGMGISIDGPAIIHNKNRVYKNEAATQDSVLRGISLLKQHGMKFGTISVITNETAELGASEFFKFFIENGIPNIALNMQNPALNIGREEGIDLNNYSKFLVDLFDLWYERNDPNIRIREFNEIIRGFLYGKLSFCILAGNCFGRYFAIDPDGNTYHCDEFMFDKDYLLGNVMSVSFEDIISNEKMQKLIEINNNDLLNSECRWSNVCHGGCPKRRYVTKRLTKSTPTCCGWAKVIEHAYSRLVEDKKLKKHILKVITA